MNTIKNENKTITKNSSPEEVSQFLAANYNLTEENKISLIKENISGDILPLLDNQEFKELGIKLGQKKKIQKFISENIDDLTANQIDNVVNVNSDKEEIKIFLANYLNIKDKEKIKDIDGKKLISLNEQEMKNIGLTIGQRKKLVMFIEKMQKTMKENNVGMITPESSAKEVEIFLKNKFNVSDKIIKEMGLDGESLFLLSEADIDEIEDLPSETKNLLKNFLNNKIKETNSNITEKQTKKENKNFYQIDIFTTPNGENKISNFRNIDNNENIEKSDKDFNIRNDNLIKENIIINNNEKIIYENKNDINNENNNNIINNYQLINDNIKGENNNLIESSIYEDINIKNEKNETEFREYEGFELDKILPYPIINYKIEPIILDSKYLDKIFSLLISFLKESGKTILLK